MIQFSRMTFAAFGILAASSAFDAAQADPYRWCADYTVLGGIGARNCYFVTWDQCRAAVSGVGGMCVENSVLRRKRHDEFAASTARQAAKVSGSPLGDKQSRLRIGARPMSALGH